LEERLQKIILVLGAIIKLYTTTKDYIKTPFDFDLHQQLKI